MKHPETRIDAASAEAADEKTTERLIALDEWTAEGTVAQNSSLADAPVLEPDGVADCLQLIERVRQFQPDCLADLQFDDGQGTTWLDGTGECPRQFGRFEIRRQLGEGGFGLVFLAFDPSLEREIALKIPRITTLVTESTQQRFLREAKAAGALNHRNIAAVHELGRVGAVCYIASAYYKGGSLAESLKQRGPLDLRRAAGVVAVLAEGVHYAHSRGILHRDLKPGNVLLDTAGDADELTLASLRIADFGLARLVDDDTSATQTGSLVGTPAYMSPEQADSRLDEISTASDIYALGAILYELLTGRPPFCEGSTLAILEAVRSTEPAPPRRIRDEIPRDLEAICLKCLRKTPEQRYATANALSEDLNRWLNGETVSARSISRPERVIRWCRRNPTLTVISMLAVTAVLVGCIASTILWRRAARHAAQTELRSQQLDQAVDNLKSAIDILFVTVAESAELKGHDAEPLRQKLLEQAGKYYQLVVAQRPDDTELGDDYAETLFSLGLVNQQLGDVANAETIIRQALDALAETSPSETSRRHEAEWNRRLGQVLDKLGRHDEARRVQMKAIRIVQAAAKAEQDEDGSYLIAETILWSDVAGGELIESDLTAAGQAAEKSVLLWQNSSLLPTPDDCDNNILAYANSLWILGIAKEETGLLTEAEEYLREAVELLQPAVSRHNDVDMMMLLGRAYKKLGIAIAKQDRLDDARTAYESGLTCLRELCERHPRVPEYRMEWCSTRYSLSVTEYLAGNRDRTLELLGENVREYAHLAETFTDQRIDYLNRQGVGWNMICTVHREDGQLAESIEAIENALECYRKVERERPNWIFNQILIAESEVNLGNLLTESKVLDKALLKYESAKYRVQKIVTDQPAHDRARRALYGAHNRLAGLHLRQEHIESAAIENDAALRLFQDITAWEATVRNAQILGFGGSYEDAVCVLEDFLRETAADQKHYLATARTAASILRRSSSSDEPILESLRAIGMEAIRKAELAADGDRDAFRESLQEDKDLAPLFVD